MLLKHLRVLDAFTPTRPFLTLSEIADESGLARSTTHRLIAELVEEGLLERLPDRTYQLGLRLWELAARTPGALGLRELARPWMGAVHARIRQHTQLGVMRGRDVLFIERLSASEAVVNATVIGGRIPLPLSSSGLVLLAFSDATFTESVIAHGWSTPTPQAIATGAALLERVARVKTEGSAVLDGHIYPESRGIAVPVFGPHGALYAAMSVVVPNDKTSPQGAIELLTVAAAGVTSALEKAYLPEQYREFESTTIRPLISTSPATLEYFASVRAPLS